MAQNNDRPVEGGGLLGLLFGAVIAIAIALIFDGFPLWVLIVLALVLGGIGWRYGDTFWFWFLGRLRHFVP